MRDSPGNTYAFRADAVHWPSKEFGARLRVQVLSLKTSMNFDYKNTQAEVTYQLARVAGLDAQKWLFQILWS